MVTKRMTDLTRINDLEKQLAESRQQTLDAQAKLRVKEIDDLARQAEVDVLQMLSSYKRWRPAEMLFSYTSVERRYRDNYICSLRVEDSNFK